MCVSSHWFDVLVKCNTLIRNKKPSEEGFGRYMEELKRIQVDGRQRVAELGAGNLVLSRYGDAQPVQLRSQ